MTEGFRPVYAVRLSVRARDDVTEAALWLAELNGDSVKAEAWSERLYQEIGKLATSARAYAVAARETKYFGRETRQMLYRRNAASTAYRIFFTIAEDGPDGASVTILHVRHGSRKPLTRKEAGEILASE